MATTKYILEKIKLEGELKDLIAKSNGENVDVTYGGSQMTLAAALASIFTSVSGAMTSGDVDTKISTAIDNLIDGAPETYDTLKEIADYIKADGEAAAAMTTEIGKKVDKVTGKQLSTEDFTTALKTKLEGLANYTHPTSAAGAKTSGLYKITTDATGHVTAAAAVTKADITKLGIPAQDTTYSEATTSAAGLMAADDKQRLDNLRGVRYGTTAPADMLEGELFIHVVTE